MEEFQKVNSIGLNNSTVWKSKKWYTTNSKNKKKMLKKVITVRMDFNKESLLQSRVTVKKIRRIILQPCNILK